MASPLQFAYRTQKTIGVFNAAPTYAPLAGFTPPDGNLRCCAYSPCGRLFGYVSAEAVSVVDTLSGAPVMSLPLTNVYEIGFSPHGTFLITWERPGKDETGDATKNLKVWRAVGEAVADADRTPLGSFVQKSQGGWNLQYTADEKFCARMVTNEVQFYESHDLRTVWNKLRAEGVADYALAPGDTNAVAVVVPERKGQPATVQVFGVPEFDSPISRKNFFKADKVQLKWNNQGTSLLVLAQTEVDKSNKSYYGETTLYLLSAKGQFDARVSLDKEGPIHDVSWSPNSKEFGIVYGFMPAKATIFNHRAVATHSFALAPRNTIIFSPTGRFVLVAGFGNLAGQMDVYDLERDFRKVTTIESGNPSVCQWSGDSRYILTATTSPRLRVDNGVKLWHVGGSLMYNEDMLELYSVMWRPTAAEAMVGGDPLSPVPSPHVSATAYLGTIKTPSKPAGAYRPPGARGLATPLHFKREDEGGAAHVVGNGASSMGANGFSRSRRAAVPGAEPVDAALGVSGAETATHGDEALSKAALKNKKKRNKKHQVGAEGRGPEGGGASGAGAGASVIANMSSPVPQVTTDRAGSGSDGRSPERRNDGADGQRRQGRSISRNNQAGRLRTTSMQPMRGRGTSMEPGRGGGDSDAAAGGAGVENDGENGGDAAQNPNAKKIRSLTKKLRAIEDLEMRHAGGEKLEDTQLRKISTKDQVQQELDALSPEGGVPI